LRLTVGCGPAPAAGTVCLKVPPGLSVEPAGPLAYDLPGRGHAGWELTVRADPDAPRGRYFVTAQISDPLGQLVEDAALVAVGEPGALPADLQTPGLSLAELVPLLEADQRALLAEVDVRLVAGELSLRPGQAGEIAAVLRNGTPGPVRGEAQLISPFGSWDQARQWSVGFAAAPGASTRLSFPVTIPATGRPGQHWWAIFKIMYYGRIQYSAPVSVTVVG
jgi:hypothetical protein